MKACFGTGEFLVGLEMPPSSSSQVPDVPSDVEDIAHRAHSKSQKADGTC